jgi:hypothetical protein
MTARPKERSDAVPRSGSKTASLQDFYKQDDLGIMIIRKIVSLDRGN